MTTTDFELLDPARAVALLPVGAIEQHGPHLPLATDAIIAEQIAHRAAAATKLMPSWRSPISRGLREHWSYNDLAFNDLQARRSRHATVILLKYSTTMATLISR